jgi:hypothetical protein
MHGCLIRRGSSASRYAHDGPALKKISLLQAPRTTKAVARYKNQHFVQKAYLEGFAAKKLPEKWQNTPAIWVLKKNTGEIRLRSIEKTAARSYYYSFRNKHGIMDPLIEKWFNPVEDAFPRLRQHIRDHITEINLTGTASNLDLRYKRLLAEYVYIHIIRVPSIFDELKQRSIAYQLEASSEGGIPYDENHAQVLALRTMIRIGQAPGRSIVDILMKRNMDVEFFPRTKVAIATSDAPVMMYDETRAAGLTYESTAVFFPLDSAIMLRFAEFGQWVSILKRREPKECNPLNELVGIRARNEVYCNNPTTLEEIGKKLGLKTTIQIIPRRE